MDVDGDLAVVSVDTGDVPVLAVAAGGARAGGNLRLGDAVVALANPGGRATPASASDSSPPSTWPSGGPVGGACGGPSSTPRRWHAARRAVPWSTSRGTLVGIDTHRVGDGFYLALPADDELQRRLDALVTR